MKFLNKDGVTYLWGKIQAALNGKQNALTFDDVPTANSTNPVASGGVYNALETKQDALTFDNVPTANSDNPVKSGGVKAALDSKKNTQTAVSDPTASGTAIEFISNITQNANGEISPSKKAVQSASQSQAGLMSAADKTNLDGIVRENLLDNWYFIGGGSQSGRHFPINLSGKTVWKGTDLDNGRCIDRWRTSRYRTGSKSISLTENGIIMSCTDTQTNAYCEMVQVLKRIIYPNDHVTLSILENGNLHTHTFIYQDGFPFFNTDNFAAILNKSSLRIRTTYGQTTGAIQAVKLEIGDTQTLAKNVDGVWKLIHAIPDFDMELLKCQLSTADSSDTYANRKLIPITVNMGTVTGTGSTVTVTKTVTGVTSSMTVDRIEFGTPSAVQSGWTVTTATDSVTFSATINGSTTVKIKLSDNIDVTGT